MAATGIRAPGGPGLLRDRVRVKTITAGATGNIEAFLREQSSRIEPVSGREIEIGHAQGYEVTHRITFRRTPAITTVMVLYDQAGTRYEVMHVRPFPPPNARQVAYCKVVSR